MISASGVLFVTPDRRALLLKRGPKGDAPGTWAPPGGGIEEGETAAQAAAREVLEETGHRVDPAELTPWTRRVKDDVDFTTFLCRVDEPFPVKLSDESTGHAWAPLNDPPQPMHPGAAVSLAKFGMTELDLARAIRDGELTSPQRIGNVWLFAMRLTGTGVAYRHKLKEYAFRAPEIYLTEEALPRWNGVPVIWEHPPTNALTSKEFAERVIGAVCLPYILGAEVWGITRINDAEAAELMMSEQLSTSPAVVWGDPTANERVQMTKDKAILFEGEPTLIDHLAVCEVGVWDKDGPPIGIQSEASTGEAEMAKEEAKADSRLDSAISKLRSIRVDVACLTTRF